MRIKSLRVRNFASLIDIDLPDLPNLVVFIGKNSAGKSNLIDALALLFTEFGTDADRSLGSVDDYQHLFPNHDTQGSQPPEIAATITLTPEEWTRILSLEHGGGSTLKASELRLSKRIVNIDGEVWWKTHQIESGDFEVVLSGEVVSRDMSRIPGPIDVGTQEVLNLLGELMRSSFQVIHTTDNPRSWADRFSERPTILEPEHVDELWNLSQSKGSLRQQWTRLVQQYSRISPNQQSPAGVASSIQVEEGTRSVPIGMTGEGSQAMLRLIDQLDRGPQIMAIEEPETHLHPALVKQIGQLLAVKANEGKQLFICTHSPFLVEQSSLENFFTVKKELDKTQVSPIGGIAGLKNLLLDIGMRPSDILFSNAILLVEGLSDEVFFDHLSNKVNVPLAGRHVKVVRANGYPRGKRKIEFWTEVGRDAGIPLYLILDKDAEDEAQCAIKDGRVGNEHCLILEKGNLEDYYPWEVLQEVLAKEFEEEGVEPIPVGERVAQLRRLLSRKAERNAWKPIVAEEVVKIMTRDEAESEMDEIVAFLRKIYYEVNIE